LAARGKKKPAATRPPGRPRLAIDPQQVEELAAIDCSYAEMALILKCDASTLTRRFAQVIEAGRARGRSSLKRKQFALAMEGNPTMLIWLGKIRLSQKETQVVETRELPQIVIE
jgi:hypothetical protein